MIWFASGICVIALGRLAYDFYCDFFGKCSQCRRYASCCEEEYTRGTTIPKLKGCLCFEPRK